MAGCCMNRRPPSPDAPPSRPILRRRSAQRGDALATTFPGTSTTSHLSKQEDVEALQSIFESEKLSIDEDRTVKNQESSNTLHTVKQKLRKHLSRDSDGLKRLSRSSVGTSEGEIERRAELRRIRQKRIRDELSTESIYDDDARSLSSVIAAQSSSGLAIDVLEHGPSSLPSLTSIPRAPPNMAAPPMDLPPTDQPLRHLNCPAEKGLILESRFYGLSSWDTPLDTPRSRSAPDLSCLSNIRFSPDPSISRRLSSPVSTIAPLDGTESSPIPPAPALNAVRPSDIITATSSWRLSFCGPNRGEHLRKLSQAGSGQDTPASAIASIADFGIQPMSMWLNSQGLRPPTCAFSSGASEEHSVNLDLFAFHQKSCSAATDYGGVDGSGDSLPTVHLNEMDISRRLAPHGLHSSASSPHLSSYAYSHQRGISTMSEAVSGHSRKTHQSHHKNVQNTSDSTRISQYIPDTWNSAMEDGTSSYYPSGGNSIQPSPRSSHLDLRNLFTTRNSDHGEPVDWKLSLPSISPKSNHSRTHHHSLTHNHSNTMVNVKAASAVPSTVSLALPPIQYRRRSTLESSIAVSETDSYRQREVELGAMKTRFPESEVRSSLTSPRSSKFREDFNVSTKVKKSAFSKLITKTAISSYDGQMEKMLGIPLPGNGSPTDEDSPSSNSSKPGPLNALSDLNTAQSWGRAIYLNTLNATSVSRTSETLSSSIGPSLGAGPRKLSWGKMNPQKASDSDRLLAKKDEVMGDWERQMNKTAQKAKDKSKRIVQKSGSDYDRRYPASWSKFSSFDRAERTNTAGNVEGVAGKDFAVQSEEDGKTIWFKGERGEHPNDYVEEDPIWRSNHKKRSFLKALGESWKEKLSMTADIEVYETVVDQARGRRGSIILAGPIEYPELELLPMQIMSGIELEHQVEEEMEEEETHKKEDELDAIFGKPVQNMGEKIEPVTPAVQMAQKHHLKGVGTPKDVAHTMGGYFERIPHHRSDMGHKSKVGVEQTNVGPDTTAFDEHVAAVVTLKEKMDAASKRGGRRGPVARKKIPTELLTETPQKLQQAIPQATLQETPQEPPQEPSQELSPEDLVGMPLKLPGASGIALRRDTKNAHDGALDSTDDEHDDAHYTKNICMPNFDEVELSIADPKFYDDCLFSQMIADGLDFESDDMEDLHPPTDREKFKTWSGKEWMGYKSGLLKSPRRVSSFGDMLLRKSTDEFQCELVKMEKLERDKALEAAERAWGNH